MLTFGKVVGRFIEVVENEAYGGDGRPIARPIAGSVRFTPMERKTRIEENGELEAVAFIAPVEQRLDRTGSFEEWLVEGVYNVSFEFPGRNVKATEIAVGEANTEDNPLNLVDYIVPAVDEIGDGDTED